MLSAVTDELLHHLLIPHWEFAGAHDHAGSEGLATEVLRRQLYGTFVHACTLPLGMDQGIPLEIAIRNARSAGKPPTDELLRAQKSSLERETRTKAREHLEKWRQWLRERV